MNSVVKELIEFEIVHDVFWSFCQLQDDLSSRLFDSMHHFSVSLPFHLETVHTYDPITDLEKKKEDLTNVWKQYFHGRSRVILSKFAKNFTILLRNIILMKNLRENSPLNDFKKSYKFRINSRTLISWVSKLFILSPHLAKFYPAIWFICMPPVYYIKRP